MEHFGERSCVILVRYAYDFVVATRTREDTEEAKSVLILFLGERSRAIAREDRHHSHYRRVRLPRVQHPQIRQQQAHSEASEERL